MAEATCRQVNCYKSSEILALGTAAVDTLKVTIPTAEFCTTAADPSVPS